MSRFYVVFKARPPGVYDNWVKCNAQVDGFSNNLYQGYKTWEEANTAWKLYKREADQAAEIKSAIAEAGKIRVKNEANTARNETVFKDLVISLLVVVVVVQMVVTLVK